TRRRQVLDLAEQAPDSAISVTPVEDSASMPEWGLYIPFTLEWRDDFSPRQALHPDPRLPDERVRLGPHGRRAPRLRRPGPERQGRGGRPPPGQHRFHPPE